MSESGSTFEGAPKLDRVIGPIGASCIVIGAIIGVGIFFNPTQVAATAGSANLSLVAWAVGGVIAMLGALCFAELGALYPATGGQYLALRDAYGPFTGFLFVFCNATAIQAGAIGIIGVICARHIGQAVTGQDLGTPAVLVICTALILGLAGANILGVRVGSGVQNVTVFAKVLTLLAVTGIAILFAGETPAASSVEAVDAAAGPAASGLLGTPGLVFAAVVPAFFAFGGWQHALWIAGEIERPRRNIPIAIIGGVALVVAVYLLANWAYFRMLGYDGVVGSGALAADAVATVWPEYGRRLIAAAVAVSAFGVLNAQLLSGPRLIHGMARDGRFFRVFAHVNPRRHTPLEAIVLLAGMALVLLFGAHVATADGVVAIDTLTIGVVLIDSVFFALTGLAVIVLRTRRADAERPFKVRWPVAALFVLGEVGIITGVVLYREETRTLTLVTALAWIALAAAMYAVFFAGRRGVR
ncbi:MAG: APC family permease [Planctomycetota bacterium]